MRKMLFIIFLVTIFLVEMVEATSLSMGKSLVLVKTIQGKFDLLDEKGADDFSRKDGLDPRVETFYKVVSIGIPREKIAQLIIIIWNCDGKKSEFSERDFRIYPDGKIAFPIGVTVNQELFRIFSGEFLIKIYR